MSSHSDVIYTVVEIAYSVQTLKQQQTITLSSEVGALDVTKFGRTSRDPNVNQFFNSENCMGLSSQALQIRLDNDQVKIEDINRKRAYGFRVTENGRTEKLLHKTTYDLGCDALLEFEDDADTKHSMKITFLQKASPTTSTGTGDLKNFNRTIFNSLKASLQKTAATFVFNYVFQNHLYYNNNSEPLPYEKLAKYRNIKLDSFENSVADLRKEVINKYNEEINKASSADTRQKLQKERDHWARLFEGGKEDNEYSPSTRNTDIPLHTLNWVQECDLTQEDIYTLLGSRLEEFLVKST